MLASFLTGMDEPTDSGESPATTLNRIRTFAPTAAKLAESGAEYLATIKTRRHEELAGRKEREVLLACSCYLGQHTCMELVLTRQINCRPLWCLQLQCTFIAASLPELPTVCCF